MIGIDVIDLTYPENFKKHSFEAYASRILHSSERTICSGTPDLILLWCLKESIYKAWCNGGGEPFFNPKRIQITLLDPFLQTFAGVIGVSAFYGSYSLNDRSIVSVAASGLENLCKIKVYEAENRNPELETGFLFGTGSDVSWSSRNPVNHVVAGRCSYYYSRSHHGNRYASAILPIA